MGKDEKEIISLIEQFENSPERALFIQMDALRGSYRMFVGNYRELIALLDVVETPVVAIRLSDVKRRKESLRVFEEATRLLHNFLASAMSLVDHTRAHVYRIYEGHPFVSEYEARVAKHFASSPVQRFVQDLRNYTLHYTLPVVSKALSYSRTQDQVDFTIAYNISVKELRKWDNWSREGRQYLNAFPDRLPLKKLASDYFSLVDEFYKWLDEREREVNSEKLERHRQMQKRIASLTNKNET